MKKIFLPKQEHELFIKIIHFNLYELIKRYPLETNIELYWILFDLLIKTNKRVFIYPIAAPSFGDFNYFVERDNELEIKFFYGGVKAYKIDDYISFVENLEDGDVLFPYLYFDGIMHIDKKRFTDYDSIEESEILEWRPIKNLDISAIEQL